MGIPWGIPEIQWFCLKQLKTAYSKHFEEFPATEKFKKQILQQTTVNMCETGHNHLTFTTVEQKIGWEYLEAYLRYSDCAENSLKQAILSILRILQLLKNLKNKFCYKPLRICVKLVTITLLSPLLSKKFHGNTLRHAWDTVILLKTAYFKHFEHFPAIEKSKKTNFAANHSEYVWNWSQWPDFHHCWAKNWMGIPWGIPEIQWFCLKQLKTAYSKHFEEFPATEKFKKQILL